MEILSRDGWSGVTDIANELGVNKSTAFRLMATLRRRGFVEQHPTTQKYRLGFAVLRLATGVRTNLDLPEIARPVCEELSERTGETVNIAVLEGDVVLNIDQVNMAPSAVSVNWFEQRSLPHATSTGKVLLAFAAPTVVEEYLDGDLEALTPNTITSSEELRRQLEEVRDVGYAYTLEELEIGLNAVSAPIRSGDGETLAALCVSGPNYRLTADEIEVTGKIVAEAAAEISLRLGYIPPSTQDAD
jgi:IclR family transcriptional regulator, acetate operon repressor